ncbi:MAG: LysE family translocator [Acidimicrobiia bacterium]
MNLLGFVVAGVVALLIPGPDFALVVHSTLTRGRRHGIAATFGIAGGLLVHATLALVGLSAIIYASSVAYTTVRIAGAAYLTFLGVLALRDAFVRRDPAHTSDDTPVEPHAAFGPGRSLRKGLLTNLLNAKAILFFVAFLPQFAGSGPGTPQRIFVLGVLQAAMAIVYFSSITLGVHAAQTWMQRRRTRQILDVITGLVFCAFGIEVIWALLA